MSEYRTIFGKAVKALASDPTDAGAEGQIWYNTTTGSFRTVLQSFAFSSGGSMPVARDLGTGGGATQNSAWVAAGENGATVLNSTAEYNGASWTTTGNIGTGRIRLAYGNNGPESAGLATGGFIPPSSVQSIVEEYNGSTWAAGTGLPTTIQFAGGTGPQTANIILGGVSPLTRSLEYDGSTWTTGGSSSENLSNYGLAGIQTAALAFYGSQNSGGGPPYRTTGEEYNGASWSTVAPSLINQRGSGAATGTTSAAIFLGNSTTVTSWDGTSLTNEPAMSQSRGNGFSGGLATSGVVSGGSAPGSTANVEEFNRTIYAPIAATWASGGNLSTARYGSVGAGTSQDAALVAAGTQAPAYTGQNATEEYNGSTWGAGGNYPLSGSGQRGCGSLTAALGTTPTSTNTYDGSTWTNLGAPSNLNTPRAATWLVGSSTAGLIWGGNSGPTRYNVTEEWDGSAWTTSPGTLSDSVSGSTGFGIQTAALRVAGDLGPSNSTNVDSYNGTTWTASTAYPIAIKDSFGTGTQTDGLVASGAGGPGGTDVVTTVVSAWNGSSWSTTATMGTSRRDNTGGSTSGPATAAVQAGGNNPPTTSIANTEEFTGEIPALDYKTITTS